MRSFFLLLLLTFPFALCAAENYQQFAEAQPAQQQQQTARFTQEAMEAVARAEQNSVTNVKQYSQLSSGIESISPDKKQKVQSRKKILVFVSCSMPEISLRQWLSDAHKVGASVIIRGLKNNSFKETAIAISNLLGEDKAGGIELNPVAFQEFKITQVPAVVVVDENSHTYDIVYGNVSLEYALQVIAKKQVHN